MANKSLNTQKYATFAAAQLAHSVHSNTAQVYLAVGRPTSWENEPNDPDTPTLDTQSVDFAYWRDLLGAKRIASGDACLVIPRRNWEAGTVYDQYDDTAEDLMDLDFYVVDQSQETGYHYVYKCLWNNYGAESTVSPAATVGDWETRPISLSDDGYVWKYLYRIEPSYEKFLTTEWMPVYANTAVAGVATQFAGQIPVEVPLLINDGGSGYDPTDESGITITIDGDGANAEILFADLTFLNNAVANVVLTSGGLGYTKIDAIDIEQFTANSAADLRVIIPPFPNHGFNPVNELGAAAVMFTSELAFSEDDLLTTVNDYRRIMLLVNPLLANGAIATDTFYRQTYDCVLASNTGVFQPDDLITVQNYNVTGRVVDVVTSNGQNVIRITDVADKGRADAFVEGDQISSNSVTGVISTVSEPELTFFSGDVVYVHNHTTIERSADQTEQFKLVFNFGS